MLKVASSRQFKGKKDPNRTFYVCDLVDENGQIAVDVFTDQFLAVGSYVTVEPYIYNHQVRSRVVPLKEK